MRARCKRLAGSVISCGSVAQSRLNESHPASNRHRRPINGGDTETRYVVQDPAEPLIEDVCGTPVPVRILLRTSGFKDWVAGGAEEESP
jgi:hypothetical protein